jgi:hypothetical protein
MPKLEITEIEERLHGHLLFNVRAFTEEGRIDVPIDIRVRGSTPLDEEAVLRSTLAFAEELAGAVRLRLS